MLNLLDFFFKGRRVLNENKESLSPKLNYEGEERVRL